MKRLIIVKVVLGLAAGSLFSIISGCQKIPEPKAPLPFQETESQVKETIEKISGEIAERDEEGHITMLILQGPKVNDQVLAELQALKKLEYLELHNSKVTISGFKQFQKASPKCKVSFFSDLKK